MGSAWRLAALFVLLAGAAHGAAADEVVLRNGERIRGEVAAMAGGKLVMRTDYAGEGGALELALVDIAYLNPEPWQSGVGVAYDGRVTLSAAYTRGNVEDERINSDGELTARARRYRYAFSAKIDRRSDPALGTATAWRAGTNYDRFLAADRFVYARGSLEHDRAKDIDRRAAAGFGYGAELLATARASLTVRGGLDYVAVDRFSAANERYPALGWGVKAASSPWFHEHEGFWNLEESDAVTLRSKTGLRVPLLEGLGASAQLNLDWERRPAAGRKSTDATLLLGVDYAW